MLSRYARALRRLTSLPAAEWRDLLRAQWELLAAQVYVWARPKGRIAQRETAAEVESPERHLPRARQLGHTARRAAELGVFRPACLVRSVALQRLLEARGVRGSAIRVGVQMREGRLHAHAWVEYGGEVIGERDGPRGQFAEMPGLSIVHRE